MSEIKIAVCRFLVMCIIAWTVIIIVFLTIRIKEIEDWIRNQQPRKLEKLEKHIRWFSRINKGLFTLLILSMMFLAWFLRENIINMLKEIWDTINIFPALYKWWLHYYSLEPGITITCTIILGISFFYIVSAVMRYYLVRKLDLEYEEDD